MVVTFPMITKKTLKNNVQRLKIALCVLISQIVHKKDALTSQKTDRNDLL
jgi:hypothetical protein